MDGDPVYELLDMLNYAEGDIHLDFNDAVDDVDTFIRALLEPMGIVSDLNRVVKIMNEMIVIRKEITRLLDEITKLVVSVDCGNGIAIRCDTTYCDIVDTKTLDRVAVYMNRVALELQNGKAYNIDPERTRSAKARNIMRRAENCREGIEIVVKDMETRLEKLKHVQSLIMLINTGE